MKSKKELLEENKNLKKEIERLIEENKSLWFLLDEIKESNIQNFKNEFQETINSEVEKVKKLIMTKPEEA